MEIKEWVRAARKHKDWTQEQLGDAMGVTKGNVSGWENGRHEPGYSQLARIAQITGFPLSQMDVGARPPQPGGPSAVAGLEPILAWEHPDDLPPGEFVMVPRLDVHLSAGGGSEQVAVDLVKDNPQAFRADWIRDRRLKPGKLAAMSATGESMEPTIHDGDSLLVDISQTTVVDGKVYALWYGDGERVKRLFRLPGGGLRICSDNPRHPPLEVGPDHPEHVRIIGRVVHRSGTGGL